MSRLENLEHAQIELVPFYAWAQKYLGSGDRWKRWLGRSCVEGIQTELTERDQQLDVAQKRIAELEKKLTS